MQEQAPQDFALWIRGVVEDFVYNSPENTLQNKANDKAFENPLVGFGRGDDPLFKALKDHVGPFHWTPREIFEETFPGSGAGPEDLTVISWVLPHIQATKKDNRKENTYPSERWARGRIFGEAVNAKLRRQVVEALTRKGLKAVAPGLAPTFEWKTSEKYGFASPWSERHIAHVCGLGTFGLCDGLITPLGKAMRLGSVVVHAHVPPTARPYKDHHAYCLFYSQGLCGKCITRCPAGALSEKGHDKVKCRHYVRPVSQEYVKAHYGFDGYGCGLCQTGVPCESKIPTVL
ncbi:MAG: epoxyqueuosine reductase [Thermodesulfobacteriota bacterium]